jgi:tetratricopeptide (TPR) repeat protein
VLGAWLLGLSERAREAAAPLKRTGPSSARSSNDTARAQVRPAAAAGDRRAAPSGRWLAPAALIVASVIVLGLLLNALAGGGGTHRAVARGAARSSGSAASATRPARPARAPAAPPATAVSPALAAQLETRGHALLEAGQPAGAIPVLQQALAATGENVAGCVEPVRETCLHYAYALYDLGRALLLDHQPAAAALILERRLRISNQREAVQSELQRARQQAARPRPS